MGKVVVYHFFVLATPSGEGRISERLALRATLDQRPDLKRMPLLALEVDETCVDGEGFTSGPLVF